MKNVLSIEQRIFDINARVDELIAVAGERAWSADEDAEVDKLRAERQSLQRQLDLIHEEEARQRTQPGREDANTRAEREGASVSVGSETPRPFNTGNWKTNLGAQMIAARLSALNPHAPDPRLLVIQAATGASEGVASDGGYAVQTDTSSELQREVHQASILVGRTREIPISTNANGIKINGVDETSRVNGSRWGGVQAYWTAEAGTLTGSKPKYRQISLELSKLTGLYYATDELLQDAAALGAAAAIAFQEEFGFKLDDALLRGTGAGMPLGVIGHAGTVSIAKETNQPAATVLKANLEKMFARHMNPSRAEWYINQDVWPALFSLQQEVGVGGVPVFLPPGGLSAAPFGMILGRPIIPIEQCESVGTVGDIILADWSGYVRIEKGGIQQASSIHVAFLTDEEVFRWILRFDGQPIRNSALTPFKGTNTTSPFVTLATRA